MTAELKVHVGESLKDVGARVLDAVRRMERGDPVRERHVSFETWGAMVRTLSPKRLEVLRQVHREPPTSIMALAQALGRDYRRVHSDVEALAAAGLLDRDANGLRAEYEGFDVRMRMAL